MHLAVAGEWERARSAGTYDRSTIDTSLAEEGFIHCSFPDQVQATADRYYRGRDDIVLLRIDPARLGVEVRRRGGAQRRAVPARVRPDPGRGGDLGRAGADGYRTAGSTSAGLSG